MPRRSSFDAERLRHVLQVQYQVVTRRQALLCGLPHSTLDRQIAPGGPWQRLLPGVYLTVSGTTLAQAGWDLGWPGHGRVLPWPGGRPVLSSGGGGPAPGG